MRTRSTRLRDRSPEERLRTGRRLCVVFQVCETALGIAVVAFSPALKTAVFVVVLIALCTAYNNLLWRTIKKQAAR
jgi:hypothetical protein